MFKSVLLLGHLRGIRIEIHISWLVIFALLVTSMSAGLRAQFSDWPLAVVLVTSVITALLFFASILAHEMGHSLVALRRGVRVKAITLFIFGGMAQMQGDSKTPNDEFWIAIAGPLVSLALAVMFGLLAVLSLGLHAPVTVTLSWLAAINLVIVIFNMVPGFPLDGGRVLRALVWKYTGDAGKGVRIAVTGGRIVAYTLFAVALYTVFIGGNLVNGLWLVLIAWFLFYLVESQGRMYSIREHLGGIKARDLADPQVPVVAPDTRLDDWVYREVLPQGQRSFIVADGDRVSGLITMSDARKVPRNQWPVTRVADVMTPFSDMVYVRGDTSAEEVLTLMTERNLNQLPLMDSERIGGWIERQHLLRSVELHMEAHR